VVLRGAGAIYKTRGHSINCSASKAVLVQPGSAAGSRPVDGGSKRALFFRERKGFAASQKKGILLRDFVASNMPLATFEMSALENPSDPIFIPMERVNTLIGYYLLIKKLTIAHKLHAEEIGTSVENNPLILLRKGPKNNKSIFIEFGCHGNEIYRVRELLSFPETLSKIKDTYTYYFILTNPDGLILNTRENARGKDINRDFIKFTTPEARALNKFITANKKNIKATLSIHGARLGSKLIHMGKGHKLAKSIKRALRSAELDYPHPYMNEIEEEPGIFGMINPNKKFGTFSEYAESLGIPSCAVEMHKDAIDKHLFLMEMLVGTKKYLENKK